MLAVQLATTRPSPREELQKKLRDLDDEPPPSLPSKPAGQVKK